MHKLNIYDNHNVTQYKKGKGSPYICSICGQYVGLSDSISNQGYNLVCMQCILKMEHLTDSFDIGSMIQKAGQRKAFENNDTVESEGDNKKICNTAPRVYDDTSGGEICGNCSGYVNRDYNYCPQCGYKLED